MLSAGKLRLALQEYGLHPAERRRLPLPTRTHLLENASAAFLDIIRRHMRHLRRAVTSETIDPKRLSAVEKRQWKGWLKRDEVNEKVRALHKGGTALKAIVRITGLSRQTVRRITRGTRDDVFRSRESTLDRWNERLECEWAAGCHNGTELWRRLRSAGFTGSLRVVSEWRPASAEASARRVISPIRCGCPRPA